MSEIDNCSNFKSSSDVMTYEERIDIENVKYLLNLPDDFLKSEMYDPEELMACGGSWNSEIYIKSLKKYLKYAIFKGGKVKQSYKYSNALKDKGRLYVKGFGIQSMQFKIRGFLVSRFYNDFDIVNAHPTILKFILNKYFPNENFPMLEKYISQREHMLHMYKANKKDILISMNSDKIICSKNKLIQGLDKEFKKAQNMLWNLEEFEELKDEKKKNKKGSFLNIICCIFENKILQEAIHEYGAAVPMFDGFLLDKKFEVCEVLERLSFLTEQYGIKWKVKEHNSEIVKQDWVCEEEVLLDYETALINFNENHFIVKRPLSFCIEYGDDISCYNRADFSALVEEDEYQVCLKDGTIENRNVFKKWLKDKNKRSYERIDFIPSFQETNSRVYNTFKGFNFEGKNIVNTDAIERFEAHIRLLVDHEEESFIYLRNYIAHLFQKPDERPNIAIVIKSGQGVGKDLLIDFIGNILGKDMIYRTAKLDEIFEKFNGSLKNKLLLQLNEVSGTDGFSKKENLKDLITTNEININEKNLKPYTLTNYLRLFIFSNNLIPIEIPHDDRRYCVFKSGRKEARPYYNQLVKDSKDDTALESIFTHFKNIDISNFDLNKRPETSAYKEMKEAAINPLFKFLFETYIDKSDEEIETIQEEEEGFYFRKKTNEIYITPSNLMNSYRYYLELSKMTHIKITQKTMSMMLTDIGFIIKNVKIKGKVIKPYIIRIDTLREGLKMKGVNTVEEMIEEIDF
tara:strand:+ start:2953 stop:5178 length:2226 start_codon:yes stop_codon:yes gene_type:complete